MRRHQPASVRLIILVSSYRHAVDGLIRVSKEEGVRKLFNGADWATGRAVGGYLLRETGENNNLSCRS